MKLGDLAFDEYVELCIFISLNRGVEGYVMEANNYFNMYTFPSSFLKWRGYI